MTTNRENYLGWQNLAFYIAPRYSAACEDVEYLRDMLLWALSMRDAYWQADNTHGLNWWEIQGFKNLNEYLVANNDTDSPRLLTTK